MSTQVKKIVLLAYMLGLSTISISKVHEVILFDNIFVPSDIVIEAGDTVRWINDGTTNFNQHNVSANDGSFRCAQGCDGDGNGGSGEPSVNSWTAEVTFRSLGTTSYKCDPHIIFGMVGSVTVVEPQSTTVYEVVATGGDAFAPDDLTIQRGDVVRFTNGGGEHNINSADNSLICSVACEGDGTTLDTSPTGFPWDIYVRFDEVAEIPYFCETHELSGTPGIIRVISDTIFANGFE